jgi:hypothetical protein
MTTTTSAGKFVSYMQGGSPVLASVTAEGVRRLIGIKATKQKPVIPAKAGSQCMAT